MKILKAARSRGFTLVELAVTLVIVTLVLGSILVPLITQVEQRQISDTQKALEEIEETLVNFAVANGNLPCPDLMSTSGPGVPNDGVEDRQLPTAGPLAGQCDSIVGGIATGNVPWVTLGIANADAWGNRFRYVVNALYAQSAPATPFSIGTPGTDVKICTTAAACPPPATLSVVAAIISHGKNGYGAMNSLTPPPYPPNPSPTSADELENADTNANVVSRVQTSAGTAAGEFDDIVTWLPRYILFNRMVAAGKLP